MVYPHRQYGCVYYGLKEGKVIRINSDPFKLSLCQEFSLLLFWLYSLVCHFVTISSALCTHFLKSIVLIARHQVRENLCNLSERKRCSNPARFVQDVAVVVLVIDSDLRFLGTEMNWHHCLNDLHSGKPSYSHRFIPVNSKKKPIGADGKQNASVIINIPVLHKKYKANRQCLNKLMVLKSCFTPILILKFTF